jgi:RNA recognition motif-containing protein
MKSLFVGNMNFETAEGDLRGLFEPLGEIGRIRVIRERHRSVFDGKQQPGTLFGTGQRRRL